tara:strand:+ start:297 stop:674 length:378 start_codon:yes stop_codon:yes gene_type:complete
MTEIELNLIRELIPNLISTDHVSINTKRVNFIYGQGAIIYNDIFAVEIYVPKDIREKHMFFSVDRHYGKTDRLGDYFRKLPVLRITDDNVTADMRAQFEEAIFANRHENIMIKTLNAKELSKKVA